MYTSMMFERPRRLPGRLDQRIARYHLLRPAHECLEHGELVRRQQDLGAAAPDPAAGRVEPQVVDLDHARAPAAPRLRSARRRASSSANANGFIM